MRCPLCAPQKPATSIRPMWRHLDTTLPEVLTWDFIWEVAEAATAKNPDGTYMAKRSECHDSLYL